MKIWRKHTRSLLLSVCMLLMLLVMVPALQAEAAPSAKVRRNINKLIRVIRSSGDTNNYNEPMIQDAYNDGTSYSIVYEGNGKLLLGAETEGDDWTAFTLMNYYYNKSRANLQFYFFYTNDSYSAAVKNSVSPAAIRKGRKVGYRFDSSKSTFYGYTGKLVEAGELHLQDALKYWDVLLYRNTRLHMKDIGFTNYRR